MRRNAMKVAGPALAGLSVAGLVLAGLTACQPASPQDDGIREITIGVRAIDTNWNPSENAQIVHLGGQAVYEPLLATDGPTDAYVPKLAQEYELSDDGLTLSITLRDDVTFSDGVHMTAQNVVDYFNALIVDDGYAWGYETDRFGLEFAVTGEYTLEMTSVLPMRDDIRMQPMQVLAFTPVTSYEAYQAADTAFASGPVGTGPYVIDDVQLDQSITFVRNDAYWDEGFWDASERHFDKITLKVFADQVAALNALKSGQIDVTQLDAPLASEASAEGFATWEASGRFPTLYFIDRPGDLVPALADVRVRQAMNLAFDREAINEAINLGFGGTGTQPFIEGQAEYVDGADDTYAFDLDRARELMSDAGYADGFDLVIPAWPQSLAAPYFPIVQQSLGEIGINVELEQLPDSTKAYEGFFGGSYPILMDTFSHQWVTFTVPPNLGGYKDPEVDALVEVVLNGNLEESEAALSEVGERVLAESWYVVISEPSLLFASNDKVEMVLGGDLGFETMLSEYRVPG